MRGLRGLGINGLVNPVFSSVCPGGNSALFNAIMSYDPIVYFPFSESAGTTAINYGSLGGAANGTYSGVTLAQVAAPGGGIAPFFGGASSFVNILTAALQAGFNGSIGTLLIFGKVYNAGVWTDSTVRFITQLYINSSNYVQIRRHSTDGYIIQNYGAGGVVETYSLGGLSATDWQMYSITWNKPGDEVKYYHNGTLKETDTVLGNWSGALSIASVGTNNPASPVQNWYGYLAHVVISTSVLTQPQLATLYTLGSV